MKGCILIQNVSSQCIPALVAAKTFQPKKIIWVYTPEFGSVLNRLKSFCSDFVQEQEQWRVDARDAEALHRGLLERFAVLKVAGDKVIYHLTGGTKSMSLQGLYNLGTFRRTWNVTVQGVVMDPRSQHFDVIYPHPVNNALPCARLSLRQILAIHGNAVHTSGRSLEFLRKRREIFEKLRALAPEVRRALHTRNIGKNNAGRVELEGGRSLPRPVERAIRLVGEAGLVRNMEIRGNRVYHEGAVFDKDIFAYVRNLWMEDWAGAVLADDLSGWAGGFAGVKVRFGRRKGKGGDTQEFDFLGARDNRLVYWSCKNIRKVTPAMLFEVDALRDEAAGADFHVAGLLYAGECGEGYKLKAGRLGVHLVHVHDPDAAEQVIRISGG